MKKDSEKRSVKYDLITFFFLSVKQKYNKQIRSRERKKDLENYE